MVLSIVTPAASELIDSSDTVLRDHLRLEDDETEQDVNLDAYCAAARGKVESYLRRRFLTQTLRLTCDAFPRRAICLGVAPVQGITSVQYRDDAGDWQTVPSSVYRLVDSVQPAAVAPVFGQIWPVPSNDLASVRIDFVVGYGADASAVPPSLLHGVRVLTAFMFDGQRGPERQAAPAQGLPKFVLDMIDAYRVFV